MQGDIGNGVIRKKYGNHLKDHWTNWNSFYHSVLNTTNDNTSLRNITSILIFMIAYLKLICNLKFI